MSVARWAACAVFSFAWACGPRVFHDIRDLTPLPPGRLVVMGTVRFEPPVPEVRFGIDHQLPATIVALSLEPTPIEIRPPRVLHADGAAIARDDEAGAFVFDAPNRPFYLRAIGHYLGRNDGGYDWRGRITEIWWVFCEGMWRVEPQPTDRRIYVGELVCNYEGGEAGPLMVEDRYDPERIALAEPPGTEPIVRRLPTAERPALTP